MQQFNRIKDNLRSNKLLIQVDYTKGYKNAEQNEMFWE